MLLFTGPGVVLLSMQRRPPSTGLIVGGAAIALLPMLTPATLRLAHRPWDPVLIGAVWALTALGLVSVARAQPSLLGRQLLWIGLAWSAFIVLSATPRVTELAERYKYTWLSLAIVLGLLTFAFGTGPPGS